MRSCAKPNNISSIQETQNNVIRKITGAKWYERNAVSPDCATSDQAKRRQQRLQERLNSGISNLRRHKQDIRRSKLKTHELA